MLDTRLNSDTRRFSAMGALAFALVVSACGGGDATSPPVQNDDIPAPDSFCSIPESEIFSGGVGRGGIPALLDPLMVEADHAEAGYLQPFDRVIGIEVSGQFVAVPHNILWRHEIVNFDDYDVPLAVTYCPLTGSSMVFDRTAVDGNQFGVSGLLYKNNLVMFERRLDGGEESWFPQFMRGARCGPRDGAPLPMFPSIEMRWDAWKELHPETSVVSGIQGYGRNYTNYPYGDYEVVDNGETLFPQDEHDRRRAPKERVLGVPREHGFGMAYPFDFLRGLGDVVVVHDDLQGTRDVVVFWSTAAATATAFLPAANGQNLTFEVRDGGYFDVENGSEWNLQGHAISGPLEGASLDLIDDAFVSFWFAWSTFQPNTGIFY